MPSDFDDQCRSRQCGALLLTTTHRIEFQNEDSVGGSGIGMSAGHYFDHRPTRLFSARSPIDRSPVHDRISFDSRTDG